MKDQTSKKRVAKLHAKQTKVSSQWTPEVAVTSSLIIEDFVDFSTPQVQNKNTAAKTISTTTKCDKAQIFEKAESIAKKYKGECVSQSYSICKGKNALKFKCLNNHTFFIPVEVIATLDCDNSVKAAASSCGDWCYKCLKFYNTCKEVAALHGITVVEGLFAERITLKCDKRDHHFRISYSKKLQTLSCSDCRKEEREEWKEQLKQEEQRKNEYYQR